MDLSIQALKRYSKRSVKMGKVRNAKVLDDMISRMELYSRPLTEGQARYATAMAKQVSDEKWKEYHQWGEQVKSDAELREKLEVVARYYIKAGYHRRTADHILTYLVDTNTNVAVPDFSECQRMLSNDYAQNVWISHKAEPKFAVGDLVCIRASASPPWGARGVDSWMIISIGKEPITTSHKYNDKLGGTKKYELLEVGGSMVTTVMEKNLKKHRVPKAKKRTKNVLPK